MFSSFKILVSIRAFSNFGQAKGFGILAFQNIIGEWNIFLGVNLLFWFCPFWGQTSRLMCKNCRLCLSVPCKCVKIEDFYDRGTVNQTVKRSSSRRELSFEKNVEMAILIGKGTCIFLWNTINVFWTTSRREQFFPFLFNYFQQTVANLRKVPPPCLIGFHPH